MAGNISSDIMKKYWKYNRQEWKDNVKFCPTTEGTDKKESQLPSNPKMWGTQKPCSRGVSEHTRVQILQNGWPKRSASRT